jgi:sterol desaturase/sphingolipid hydroxylase (fatty acid hydroxylase superfamily)
MLPIVYFAIPAFVVLLLLELAWFRRAQGVTTTTASKATAPPATEQSDHPAYRGYFGPDTKASLWMGAGNVVISGLVRLPTFALFAWVYDYRLFELGTGWTAWVLLFFVEDFVYYWWHRTSHAVRLFWAAHENHHSSEYFNLSTALRQSWTTPFTVPIFYVSLPLLGFSPAMIATQISISLIYQFWIHTELIDRLPRWFEAVFNTPSHHRVHHGANVEYLDRNHGGILIVWDRLFGTFEPERAPVVYGLTKNITTFSPPRIALHEWAAMIGAALRPAPLATRLAYVFAPPGWSADGSTLTASQLRAREQTQAQAIRAN